MSTARSSGLTKVSDWVAERDAAWQPPAPPTNAPTETDTTVYKVQVWTYVHGGTRLGWGNTDGRYCIWGGFNDHDKPIHLATKAERDRVRKVCQAYDAGTEAAARALLVVLEKYGDDRIYRVVRVRTQQSEVETYRVMLAERTAIAGAR